MHSRRSKSSSGLNFFSYLFICLVITGILIYWCVNNGSLFAMTNPISSLTLNGSGKISADETEPKSQIQHKVILDGFVDTGTAKFSWQHHRGMLRGVILLAHGCDVPVSIWWMPSQTKYCESICKGLPAEISLAETFVKSGFAIVSIKPSFSKCWHTNDKVHIAEALKMVYRRLNTTTLVTPLFAFGLTNGGVYLSNNIRSITETYGLKFSGLALMNTGIWHKSYNKHNFPPVLFLCMRRNADLCLHNERTIHLLESKGVRSAQIVVDPMPLHPHVFAQQYINCNSNNCISHNESSLLYRVLERQKFLWPNNSLLLKDPNVDQFTQTFRDIAEKEVPSAIPIKDNITSKDSSVYQLLRIAWGFKETSFEVGEGIGGWFLNTSHA